MDLLKLGIYLVTSVTLFLSVTLTETVSIKILEDNMVVDFDSFNSPIGMANYTDYVDHNTYLSGSVSFDPKAMAGYYRLTESFMNNVLDPNFIKEDMIAWEQSGSSLYPKLSDTVSINNLLSDYWILVFILSLIIFITFIIPILGILFCCCRCCGNCGAKSKPSDTKRDFCNKIFQGGLMISLGTLLLLTVVCAFTTNQQMREGTHEFPSNIRKSYSDGSKYLDGTKSQAKNLLHTNYNEFADVFKSTIKESGNNVVQQMSSWQKASSIIALNNFVTALTEIKTKLTQLEDYSNELKTEAINTNNELNDIKTTLTNTLAQCKDSLPECNTALSEITGLDLTIDVSQIDVSSSIGNLNQLNEVQLKSAVDAGMANLNNLINKINQTLDTILINASKKVDGAEIEIGNNFDNMTGVVVDLESQISNVNNTLENYYSYFTTYSPYFYYGGLSISCILLLIPICISLGLIWGACGRRPEKYKSGSCTKETGSSFLMSGVLLIFIFTIIIGLLTCAMLIFGLFVDRGVCYPLRNPDHSSIIKIFDTYVNKNIEMGMNVNLSQIILRCRNNDSIYNVFNLSSIYDIDNLDEYFNISAAITDITNEVEKNLASIVDTSFAILNTTTLEILQTMTTIDPDIQIQEFEKLNQSLTNVDLGIAKIRESIENIVNSLDPNNLLRSLLENDSQRLKSAWQPLKETANKTLVLAVSVNNDLKMGSSSFAEAINKLLSDVEEAQSDINNNTQQIVEAAKLFGNIIAQLVEGYLNRVINVTRNELGQCGPLSLAMNATLIAVCDKIVLPWNGFWVALFISLLIFVPTLILSISLSSLYKRYKISKQYTEGQRFKVDKKSKKRAKQNNSYPSHEVGQYPPVSRYDDMAPKFNPLQFEQKSTRF